MSHELLKEARKELFDALVLEPSNESARRMLARVQESIRRGSTQPDKDPSSPKRTDDGFKVPEARSLSGINPVAAQQFVRTIQPIFMNKCSNATCHGSQAKNDFRLIRIRRGRGSHRVYVERNLAATLKFVDLKHPDKSPLLMKPQGSHGRTGRAVFYGVFAEKQINSIRDWVRLVAGVDPEDKQSPMSSALAKQNDRSSKRNDQTSLFTPDRPPSATSARDNSSRGSSLDKPNRNTTPSPRQSKLVESLPSINQQIDTSVSPDRIRELVKSPRKDAFDPEEFNRAQRR